MMNIYLFLSLLCSFVSVVAAASTLDFSDFIPLLYTDRQKTGVPSKRGFLGFGKTNLIIIEDVVDNTDKNVLLNVPLRLLKIRKSANTFDEGRVIMLYQDYKGRGEVEFADNQLTNFAFDTLLLAIEAARKGLYSTFHSRTEMALTHEAVVEGSERLTLGQMIEELKRVSAEAKEAKEEDEEKETGPVLFQYQMAGQLEKAREVIKSPPRLPITSDGKPRLTFWTASDANVTERLYPDGLITNAAFSQCRAMRTVTFQVFRSDLQVGRPEELLLANPTQRILLGNFPSLLKVQQEEGDEEIFTKEEFTADRGALLITREALLPAKNPKRFLQRLLKDASEHYYPKADRLTVDYGRFDLTKSIALRIREPQIKNNLHCSLGLEFAADVDWSLVEPHSNLIRTFYQNQYTAVFYEASKKIEEETVIYPFLLGEGHIRMPGLVRIVYEAMKAAIREVALDSHHNLHIVIPYQTFVGFDQHGQLGPLDEASGEVDEIEEITHSFFKNIRSMEESFNFDAVQLQPDRLVWTQQRGPVFNFDLSLC